MKEDRRLRKRKYCYCFDSRKFCCLFFVILLILLTVLLYFVFPAVPQVDIGDAYVPAGGDSFLINGGNISTLPSNFSGGFNLEIKVASNVSVYSPSWINVGIHNISLKIEAYDLNGRLIPDFEGVGKVDNLRFPSRTTTHFVFPVSVNYRTKITSVNDDPTLVMLREKCLASTQKPIQGRVTIQIEVSALSWIGVHPRTTLDRQIKCPVSDQLKSFASLA